eukprot:SAG11_NODE_1396_length_5036_cov_2.382824_6_plen_114_part_00
MASVQVSDSRARALENLERALRPTPEVNTNSIHIAESRGWTPDLGDDSFYDLQVSWEHHRLEKRAPTVQKWLPRLGFFDHVQGTRCPVLISHNQPCKQEKSVRGNCSWRSWHT